MYLPGSRAFALVAGALACAAVIGAAGAAPANGRPLLVFHGNAVLVDGVYLSVLNLPADARATPELASEIAARLRRFLHGAGYELATVRAKVTGDQIGVEIDEGRLDKVIVLGSGLVETLRLKFDLDFPGKVFNRPDLDRRLGELSRRFGLSGASYRLVAVPVRPDPGLQLSELMPFEGTSLFEPGRPYELHISLAAGPWRPGLVPELEIDSLEGGGVGVEYRNTRLLFPDDRWSVEGKVAGAVRQHLDSNSSRLVFTHGVLGARWESPPVLGPVRPSLSLRADLLDRQRPDLELESFDYATLEGSFDLRLDTGPSSVLSVGAGLQRRWLFAIDPVAGAGPQVPTAPIAQTRPYLQGALALTFEPFELRRDWKHELHLDARWYASGASSGVSASRLLARYRKVFGLGWNELRMLGRTTYMAGGVLFAEEESISEALHGPLGSDYARKLIGPSVEFRYSLLRDVVKVGLFDSLIAFGAVDRARDSESLRIADSFGLGFHVLFLDAFLLDVYAGLAFSSSGEFSSGATLSIRQAY